MKIVLPDNRTIDYAITSGPLAPDTNAVIQMTQNISRFETLIREYNTAKLQIPDIGSNIGVIVLYGGVGSALLYEGGKRNRIIGGVLSLICVPFVVDIIDGIFKLRNLGRLEDEIRQEVYR